MEWGYILQKTNTAKGEIDINYLDETSTLKASYVSRKTGESIKKTQENAIENLQAIEYISKEDTGRVNAAGFLRDMLLRKGGTAPEAMNNEGRKEKISSAIRQHIGIHGRYRGACAHKIVMSMSDELNEKVSSSGLNPDMVLISHMKKVMKTFQDKFYPHDRIGYAYGLHHDTKHLHAHIYLVNRTEKGRHVAYSRPLKGRKSPRRQIDQMGFCDEKLNRITTDFVNRMEREEAIKESQMQSIKAAQIYQEQLMIENNLLAEALQKKYKKLIEMEHKIVKKYIPVSYKIARMAGYNHSLAWSLGAGRRVAFRAKRELKKEYFALKKEYFHDLKVHRIERKKADKWNKKIESLTSRQSVFKSRFVNSLEEKTGFKKRFETADNTVKNSFYRNKRYHSQTRGNKLYQTSTVEKKIPPPRKEEQIVRFVRIEEPKPVKSKGRGIRM